MAPHEMSNTSPVAPQASEPCLRRHQNTFTTVGDLRGPPKRGARVRYPGLALGRASIGCCWAPERLRGRGPWRFGEVRDETILGSGRESC